MARIRDLDGARVAARELVVGLAETHRDALARARDGKDARTILREDIQRARRRLRRQMIDKMRRHTFVLDEAVEELIVRAVDARIEAEREAEDREAIRDASAYRVAPPARTEPLRPPSKRRPAPPPPARPAPAPPPVEDELEQRMEFARHAFAIAFLILFVILFGAAFSCRRERDARGELARQVHERYAKGTCTVVETHRVIAPNTSDRLVVTFALTIDGKRHVANEYSPTSASPPSLTPYAPQSEVPCYFDPDKPSRVFLERGDRSLRGEPMFEWILVLCIAVTAWMGFAPRRWFAADD